MSLAEQSDFNLEEDSFVKMEPSIDNFRGSGPVRNTSVMSSSRGGGSGSLFQLSCARSISPERQFLTGYTGQKFKTVTSESSVVSKVPSIGYTGYSMGKIDGKIGKIELHRSAISEAEPEEEELAITRKRYSAKPKLREPSFNENAAHAMKYETSNRQANARGQSADKILRDITDKLELKHAGRMHRHLVVRNTFALFDATGTELCSVDDFYAALLSLGIMIPNVEFEALCNEFDEQRSGEISWAKFMNRIGAGSTKGVRHHHHH